MKPFSNKSIFGGSILLGVVLVVAMAGHSYWQRFPQINSLTESISVTEQLQLDAIAGIKDRGFTTIIDLRPDGEAKDQPDSATVESAAHANRLAFAYVPVPHGEIPDSAVVALKKSISAHPGKILLYCRSGRRAARTWSLAEASRPGGLDATAIQAAVRRSGQSADDLGPAIASRIAKR